MSRGQAWLLRCGLLYLLLTGAFGVAFSLRPGLAGVFATTHAHLGLVGFFLSMVMGVAYWMMPRPGGIKQARSEWTSFWLLQAGMITRLVGEPWTRLGGGAPARALFVASGLLVLGAMLSFALAMRTRIVTIDVIRARSRPRRSAVERPVEPGEDVIPSASASDERA